MKYTIFLGLVLLMGCNRPATEKIIPQNSTLTAVYAAYNLKEDTPDTPDIIALRNALSGKIYSQIKDGLDFEKVQLLSSDQDDFLIYIVAFKQENKFYAVKAINRKTLTLLDEVLYSGRMQDDRNGTIGILKNDEALQINFINGKRTIKSLTENEYKVHFAGFCQREAGQSFGDCFRHESDEFCDSFVSCVALATQPQVSILIGIACSCNAG
ncbi:MAG: hypothetical protein WKF97_06285 [Chitinophagaceae bacterium]